MRSYQQKVIQAKEAGAVSEKIRKTVPTSSDRFQTGVAVLMTSLKKCTAAAVGRLLEMTNGCFVEAIH
jgi:hypothetical protein